VRVVLFVKLREGLVLDDVLEKRIKQVIRDNTTPRHVPAKILQVADIPRTKSGKIVELAVRNVVHGNPVKNVEALANPEALAQMLGLDTNVLVRFLVRDDEVQFEKARKLIKREIAAGRRVFVSQLVLLETEWVLRSRYSLPKHLIIEAISGLLDATDVRFEDEPAIEEALFIWKDTTADFADCLIGTQNRRLGCRATATFDVKASKLPGFMAA
jgi:predicted nucleic-acid-binding protein